MKRFDPELYLLDEAGFRIFIIVLEDSRLFMYRPYPPKSTKPSKQEELIREEVPGKVDLLNVSLCVDGTVVIGNSGKKICRSTKVLTAEMLPGIFEVAIWTDNLRSKHTPLLISRSLTTFEVPKM